MRNPYISAITAGIITAVLLFFNPARAENRRILVPVDHFPPFHIFPYDGGEPYGEVISVIRAIVRRVNQDNGYRFGLSFTRDLPFKRCLGMMKAGKAELIGGIQDKADRQDYMVLIPYKLNSNKVFLLRARDTTRISRLKDLEGKTVGTVLGYTYFKAFDTHPGIIKSMARHIDLSLKKLAVGRVDLVICPETQWQAIQQETPDVAAGFRLARYRYDRPNPVNIGIARNSWLGAPEYVEAFQRAVREMRKANAIVSAISEFYTTYTY